MGEGSGSTPLWVVEAGTVPYGEAVALQERIHQAMQQGPDDKRVNLPRRIPVYIAYFTTYLRDGTPFFGNDLYKRDDDLIRAIGPGASPSPEMLQALQSLQRFVASS